MDANDYYLNQYLNKLDEEDKRDEELTCIAKELVAKDGEFYPYAALNLSEAIVEQSDDRLEELGELLSTNMYMKAGIMLMETVEDYWWKLAMNKADIILRNEWFGEEP